MKIRVSRKAVACLIGGAAAFLSVAASCLIYWQYQSDALWRVIRHCAADSAHHPCAVYRAEEGYAVLKAREGKGQYLLIPTQPLRGIEAVSLLSASSPPYMYQAWAHRQLVSLAYGRPIKNERLSLAINSRRARSQEQLHIHIDCVREDVREQLAHLPRAARVGEVRLMGHLYQWWRIPALDPSPLHSVPFFPQGADETERGRYGLAVVSLDGIFLVLRSRATGIVWGYAEELQDHQCRL